MVTWLFRDELLSVQFRLPHPERIGDYVKRLFFCLAFALVVTFSFCSAADLDAVDTYSFDPVTMSVLDYSVMPLDLTTDESGWLKGIYQTLVNNTYLNKDSIYGLLVDLRDFISGFNNDWPNLISNIDSLRLRLVGTSDSVYYWVRELYNNSEAMNELIPQLRNTSYLPSINTFLDKIDDSTSLSTLHLADLKNDLATLLLRSATLITDQQSILSVLTTYVRQDFTFYGSGQSSYLELTPMRYIAFMAMHLTRNALDGSGNRTLYSRIQQMQEAITNSFRRDFTYYVDQASGYLDLTPVGYLSFVAMNLSRNAVDGSGNRTLYSLLWQMKEVLASDDDLALAQGQKPNRVEIEDQFFNPDKPSSLKPSDFTDLAGIGTNIGDLLSLDGNSDIGTFFAGLSAADATGQGWFSEATRLELDSVGSYVSSDDIFGSASAESVNGVVSNGVTVSYDALTGVFTLNGTVSNNGDVVLLNNLNLDWVPNEQYQMTITTVSGSALIAAGSGITYSFSIFNKDKSDYFRTGDLRLTNIPAVLSFTDSAIEESGGSGYYFFFQCWRSGTVFDNFKFRVSITPVVSASTYGLRRADPYNMNGWEDRYSWLLEDY